MNQLTSSSSSLSFSTHHFSSALPLEEKKFQSQQDVETRVSQSQEEAQAYSHVKESKTLTKWFKDKFRRSSSNSTNEESSDLKMDKTSSEHSVSKKWSFPTSIKPIKFSPSQYQRLEEEKTTFEEKDKLKISLSDESTEVQPDDMDLSLLCIDGLPWGTLGVVNHKACLSMQTRAFHELNLNEVLCCSGNVLASLILDLSDYNKLILETKALSNSINHHVSSSSCEKRSHDDANIQKIKIQSLLGGSTVNNYPSLILGYTVNCDFFHGERHSDYMFSIIADGCGWGASARLAAQLAVTGATDFINHMLTHSSKSVKTAENLAWVLVQAMAVAHENIVSGYTNSQPLGTTTLSICFTFLTSERKKYLMVASVGDCKVFLANKTSENRYVVNQVECSKRLSMSPRDPGGRLGAYVGKNYMDPDLRNLALTCIPLSEEKTIVFNMTDGVHDNLDPENLGKDPCELDATLPSSTIWSDLPIDKRQIMAANYQKETLEHVINLAIEQTLEASLDNICEFITHYCHQVTSYGRNFLEKNTSQKEPDDKKINPGKMDHCSVIAFEI